MGLPYLSSQAKKHDQIVITEIPFGVNRAVSWPRQTTASQQLTDATNVRSAGTDDPDGAALFAVVRFDYRNADNERRKEVRQMRVVPGGWAAGLGGVEGLVCALEGALCSAEIRRGCERGHSCWGGNDA